MEPVTENASIVLDISYFGYGVGLVLCGFIAGVVISVILSAINKVKFI